MHASIIRFSPNRTEETAVDMTLLLVRVVKEKSDKEIMREIQAIMRQVNSCISFLPCLDEPCKEG